MRSFPGHLFIKYQTIVIGTLENRGLGSCQIELHNDSLQIQVYEIKQEAVPVLCRKMDQISTKGTSCKSKITGFKQEAV